MPVERNVRASTKEKRKPDYLAPPRRQRRRQGDLEVDDQEDADNVSVKSDASRASVKSAPGGGWLGGFFGGGAAAEVAPDAVAKVEKPKLARAPTQTNLDVEMNEAGAANPPAFDMNALSRMMDDIVRRNNEQLVAGFE